MNDIKVPPFTDAQKMVIEATEKLGKICDVDVELDELYPTEQTNEDWLKSMTTEELAGWIYRAMFYKSCQKDVEDGAYMQMMTKKDYIENWLKEIHHG